MNQRADRSKRLTMLAIMAVLGANLVSCDDVPVGMGKRSAPDIKLTVAVDGKASEDGSVTSDVGLSIDRNPGSDVFYIIENHTPEVCNIEPAHIEVSKEDWEDSQTVVVSGVPNGIVTGDLECRFTVTLYDKDGNILTSEPGVVIVEDNDSPNILVSFVSEETATSESGTTVQVSYRLQTQPSDVVTVTLRSSDMAEGMLVDADGNQVDEIILIFTPENWNEPQIVTVAGIPDGIVDGDKLFAIEAKVSSGDANYDGMSRTIGIINHDIDKPGIGIDGGMTSIIVSESGTEAHLPIVLTAVPVCPVTVHIVSSDTTEAVVNLPALTFTPEDWNVPQIVTVTGVPDDIDDGDQAFTITISASGCFFDPAEPVVVHGINENIDVAGITVIKESDTIIVSEGGLTSTVQVVLDSKPTAPVTITLAVDPSNVATTEPTVLVFTPENWNIPQPFVVSGLPNDDVNGGHRPFEIELVAVSADAKYHEAFIAPVPGICINDNLPADVLVHPWTVYIASDVLTATFTVTLTANPGENITFPLSVEGSGIAAGFVVDKTEVHFSHTDWWRPQVVTVSIAAEIPDAFGNFFIEVDKDSGATGIYQDLDPHDVVVLYDFRNACSEPTVLGAGTYKFEVWGAQGGWTQHANPERYYICDEKDRDEWLNKCRETGIEMTWGSCEGYYNLWCEDSWYHTRPEYDTNRGGYASGILTLAEETKVWRCEGGQGNHGSPFDRIVQGGKNGGGNSGRAEYMGDDNSGGGGGSDIRIGMNTLYHRVIVAGGGGGNGCAQTYGGEGGGLAGLDATGYSYPPPGEGGTQTEGGASVGNEYYPNSFSQAGVFGYGGAASAFENNYGGSGGGGGWYGGSGGNNDPGGGAGGGGGSGYVLTAASYKPAGYALGSKYNLTNTVLLNGQEVMPAPGGGTQIGQRLDGVVRISKCDSAGDNCVVCSGGICPE